MTSQQNISARILAAMTTGMSLQAAYDHVLGAGAFAKMAGELYDQLKQQVVV